jgi:transmembrane sensor
MTDNYQPYFDIAQLIAKHGREELSDREKIILQNWLQANEANAILFEKLTTTDISDEPQPIISAEDKCEAWKNIAAQTGFKPKTSPVVLIKRWGSYAAAFLIPLAIGVTLSNHTSKGKKKGTPNTAFHQNDLMPGGNKAILTLANGSKIILDNAAKGKIASQASTIISKTGDGELVYTAPDLVAAPIHNIIATNTISTPRGGQYEIVLPDGTKVWLNSASSLKYPTVFAGSERNVELSGEAYFEVAKNAAKPFFVKTLTQTVEVLGTHFNINSYADEKSVKTTLLEGSVKITGTYNKATVKLSPGQQAVNAAGSINTIANADIDEAMAWKNGKFLFKNTDLHAIMRQLSRWYNVDVDYQGTIAERHYDGRISRNVPVSQIFTILKTSGLNFTIDGGKIIVKP